MPITYADSFNLPPEEAIKFFRGKGLKASYRWTDIQKTEHSIAFTVAKLADLDLLADIKSLVDVAISEGITAKEFSADLKPILQARGWWGITKAGVELGSPRRLETIFLTNMKTAYAEQYWKASQAVKKERPYYLYDAVEDSRVRPAHLAWNGLILPVDDPFWDTHYPPNGWRCRCAVIQLSERDVKRMGRSISQAPAVETEPWVNPRTGKAEQIPKGIDPGWNYNPGTDRAANLKKIKAEKWENWTGL